MFRRSFLAFFVVAGLAATAPASAADPMRMTDAIKAHLTALKVLQAAEGKRALFDGRPLIVVFFASW